MNCEKFLEFSRLMGVLKHLARTGWVKKDVSGPEPVAGHMYRMAIFAFFLDKDGLDRDKCIKMALVHDMAECIVGDLTPHCGVSNEEKHVREKAAMEKLRQLIPKEVGDEFVALWSEYEARESAEAKAVHQLDKFDMLAQAFEYEQDEQKPESLQEFFNSTPITNFTDPTVRTMALALVEARSEANIPPEN